MLTFEGGAAFERQKVSGGFRPELPLRDLEQNFPEGTERAAQFRALVQGADPQHLVELSREATLSIKATLGDTQVVYRYMKVFPTIDPADATRSHQAMYRILHYAGGGHLVLPAALVTAPKTIREKAIQYGIQNPDEVMVTEFADQRFMPFRSKGMVARQEVGREVAERIRREDRVLGALAGYLTEQQDMVWSNLLAALDGDVIIFDFDNCLARPFPFTTRSPLFFVGGPLAYTPPATEAELLPPRAKRLVAALSNTEPKDLAELWGLELNEAEIIAAKAVKIESEGLTQAVATDPVHIGQGWDAPPWRETGEGWIYNDWYDRLKEVKARQQ